MTGPLTAAAVMAARDDLQPTGEAYVDLAVTGATVADVPPHGRRAVAGFITVLLDRAPLRDGPAYEAHRAILGSLVLDLEAAAITDALASPADLRDPATTERERELVRQTREWAEGERQRLADATHARIDTLLEHSAELHAAAQERLDAAIAHATAEPASVAADPSWIVS